MFRSYLPAVQISATQRFSWVVLNPQPLPPKAGGVGERSIIIVGG
jgi:hypothetical protein